MDRFLIKRPKTSVDSSSNSCPTQNAHPPIPRPIPSVNAPLNSNTDEDVISDPGLSKQLDDEYDVGDRDRIRREYIAKGPCQPFKHNYPKTQFGASKRSFRDDWFKTYNWLEYSVSKDAALCFCCYLFKPINANRCEDDFLPRTATPLEDIFTSLFCLPCILCLRCMRDTCISEERMIRDPRRLYAPGRLYHIVERKPFRCGRFPPVVRTAVPVDGRFEHIVLSCNATSDHAIFG